MIIKSFLTGRHEFIIAKRIAKTKRAELIQNYRKILEKSLTLSLLITLILFQLFPRQKNPDTKKDQLKISLEVIDIPVTKQEESPPPPPPPVQEVITNYTVIVKNERIDSRKLREKIEDVTLEIEVETDNNLFANSQISDVTYSRLNRSLARFEKGVSLNINSELNNFSNHIDGNLDFNLGTTEVNKRFVDTSANLENPDLATEPKLKKTETKIKRVDTELIKVNENQFLLKESESTIGTNEYRLWNKINAALDRLDKNRFGKLPTNVQRTRNGLAVSFEYNNGVIHEIFWSKGGKVIIRVTGWRPKNLSNELERALDSLIRLTL